MAKRRLSVFLSQRAEKDLTEVYQYLSLQAPEALAKVDQAFFKAFERLESFPLSGHYVKEFSGKRYREILVYHYRVIYRHLKSRNRLQILTIRHGKRFFPSIL